jgi:hypothetical protein
MAADIVSVVAALERPRALFGWAELPTSPGWYSVFLDESGARELTAAAGIPVREGLVYAGECRKQTVHRHLMHADIGQLTLMKNVAALLRRSWGLTASRKGAVLDEPGRSQVVDWTRRHLRVAVVDLDPDVRFGDLLARLDPSMRLIGWGPDRTALRKYIRQERSALDGG